MLGFPILDVGNTANYLGRLIRSEQSGDQVTALRTQHKYDTQNRLSAQSWQLPGYTLWETYAYNNANGTLKSMELGTGRSLTFGYDNLLRLQSETLEGIYQRRRNYGETTTANKETNRPNYFIYYKPDGTTVKLGYRYLYDAAGNIKQVYSRVGTNALALESSYEYDKFGQLIKADTGNGLETYTYDTAGNMLSRTVASTVKSFGYENSRWGDLLTSYRGQKLAYEGQSYNSSTNTVSGNPVSGNPVSYYNGRRWDMTWKNGKYLASATKTNRAVTYEYDKNGLRTSKTYNGTRYDYAYAGDKLVWQGWDGNEMYFFYDNTGAPIAFWYFPKGGARVTGYYFTNAQGDVVRIEDPDGKLLASYGYDVWGKVIVSSGSVSAINPLKYRGYYHDTETGFYYLQSRYYDPVVSRFINADSYASTGQGFLGYNMFAYCGNNPVSRVDADGNKYTMMEDVAAYPANTNLLKYYDPRTGLIPGVAPINDPIKAPLKKAEKRLWQVVVPGTASMGITSSAFFGVGGSASSGIIVDREGNIAHISSISAGGGSPSAFAGMYFSATSAPTIKQVENSVSLQTGGSVGPVGFEYIVLPDKQTGNLYGGGTIAFGLGVLAIPAEVHATVPVCTDVIYLGNIFD